MKKIIFTTCIVYLSSLFADTSKIYVAMQAMDQVGIFNTETDELIKININFSSCMDYSSEMSCNMVDGCEWTMNMCMESADSMDCMDYSSEMSCNMVDGCEWMMNMCMESGSMMNMGEDTPHFIAIDEINRLWFVTTITSGYVGRYNLDTDEFIDKIKVGDSPALIVLNKNDKKLYVSRMMPMAGMMEGSVSTIIQEIDYSNPLLMESSNEFEISSPAPHGLAINSDGTEVYVTSNTADWVYKIYPDSGEIIGTVLDLEFDNPSNIETNRLKPIQCLSVNDSLIYITCSGGIAYDPFTGQNDTIPGQVQLWNSNSMSLIDIEELSWDSKPWHVVSSPVNSDIFVTLAGDNLYEGSSGVISLTFDGEEIISNWENYSNFNTLHGIDISKNGENIYVSGRGDGYLYTMSSEDGSLINSIPLADNLDMVMAGGLAVLSEENLDHSEILIIKNFSLGSVYPNPFNPIANIQYSLSESAKIKLAIYDVSGRKIEVIKNGFENRGDYSIQWNASNFSSGIYFLKLEAPNFNLTKKLILSK